jgi:oxygen-independent coproporphyrinogen III oxidase
LSYRFLDLEHLYIHWPFCPYKCHFCDFVAMASHEQFMTQYHHALIKELYQNESLMPLKPRLRTIYFGGGTPSTYPPELLLDTFAILRKLFDFDQMTEVTIEVNPGTVTPQLFDVWSQAGINRLSIGVQSLKDVVLSSLNRHQTKEQVQDILKQASGYFKNLSVDFILGLPGVTDEEWKNMIQEAMSWPIQHISVYFLTVHEDTPLYFKVARNKVQLPPDDAMVDLYNWTVDYLREHGFERYEISNFAKKGFRSLHNAAYWNRKPYRGFGLGACSFNGTERFQNSKNLGKYIQNIEQNQSVIDMSETLSESQIMLEKLMLGLRQTDGVVVKEYLQTLSLEKSNKFFENVALLESAQLVSYRNGNIQLTPRGYALENEVTLKLFS